MGNPYIVHICPILARIKMAIAEFRATIQTQKRITIPKKINVESGDVVLVKIFRINKSEEDVNCR